MINLNDNFINKSNKIHDYLYDYSLIDYKNNKTKVKIICKEHGIFEQTPKNHLIGQGCPNCKYKYMNITKQELILELNKLHNNKYEYIFEIDKFNSRTILDIKCKIHGSFKQPLYVHIKGHGCSKCNGGVRSNKNDFIKKSNKIHNNKFDYSIVNYIRANDKVKIICKEHGVFEQTPNKHLLGRGCPFCKMSKGENIIKGYLDNKSINYEQQKMFEGCKYKRNLKFDFYLPLYNICVEYDGEQHFEKYRFEKNDNKLNIRKIRDQIKTKYCKNNNIKLIRLNFNNIYNIGKILNKNIIIK